MIDKESIKFGMELIIIRPIFPETFVARKHTTAPYCCTIHLLSCCRKKKTIFKNLGSILKCQNQQKILKNQNFRMNFFEI